jgi:hypothetical protein
MGSDSARALVIIKDVGTYIYSIASVAESRSLVTFPSLIFIGSLSSHISHDAHALLDPFSKMESIIF